MRRSGRNSLFPTAIYYKGDFACNERNERKQDTFHVWNYLCKLIITKLYDVRERKKKKT